MPGEKRIVRRVGLFKSDQTTQIDPATEQKQDDILTALGDIFDAVDELEIKAENVDLNTDDLEAKVDAVTSAISSFNTAFNAEDFATEATLALIRAKTDNLNITLSALRDAIRGSGTKDFTTLQTAVEAVTTAVGSLQTTFIAEDFATSAKQDAQTGVLESIRDRADYPLPAAQVTDLKTVTVSNPTADPETGLAKEAKQDTIIGQLTTLLGIDFATEATLSALEGKDFATSAKQDEQTAALETLRDRTPRPDVFGNTVVGQRDNQIEVHYDDTNWATYVTQTTSGGGGTSQHEGHIHFASGTGANGRSKAVSLDSVVYRPMHETYAGWTAAWPTAGVANSYAIVGMADTNLTNGILTGYDGTGFGLLYYRNGVKTFIARASWDDPCQGAAGSKFTRNGTPETLDPAYVNIFRARVGLLGSAQLVVEVYSPDGEWVPIYTFKRPNTDSEPTFTNFDLPMFAEVRKTGADATALEIRTACWAAGTTSAKARLSDIITDRSLAETVRAIIEGKDNTGTYRKVSVNAQGRLQVTNDSVGTTGAAVPAEATLVGYRDGSGNLQPFPLPATSVNQDTIIAQLAVLLGLDFATEATLSALGGKDFATEATLDALSTFLQSYDFATSAKQDTLNTTMANLFTGTPDLHDVSLIAAEVYVTEWYDTLGFASIVGSLTTNQYSALGGLVAQWSDLGTEGPSDPPQYPPGAGQTAIPGITLPFFFAPQARYFRVKYTNGATPATVHGNLIFRRVATEAPAQAIAAAFTDLTVALNTKGLIAGKRDDGQYGVMGLTNSNHPKFAIAEHTVDTPIKATTLADWDQVEIGTTAQQVDLGVGTRKTIAVKALSTNEFRIFIGFDDTVSETNGWELLAGDPIPIDIANGVQLWAIAEAGTPAPRLCIMEVGG